MGTTDKSLQGGKPKEYNLNEIYARVIALMASDRDVNIKDVLGYELAPVPTSMFTNNNMRIAKGKSSLKRSLQVEISSRSTGFAHVTVIDGMDFLWTVHWPTDGTVADYIINVKNALAHETVTLTSFLIGTMTTAQNL